MATPNVRASYSPAMLCKRADRLWRKRRRKKEKGYFTGEVKVGLTPRQRRKRANLEEKHVRRQQLHAA